MLVKLTAIDLLLDEVGHAALVHGGNILGLERLSVLAGLEHARVVHGALERVALPAEEVVGVAAVALGIAKAQRERVAARRPERVVACAFESAVGSVLLMWHAVGRARRRCLLHSRRPRRATTNYEPHGETYRACPRASHTRLGEPGRGGSPGRRPRPGRRP